ncbi:unnamed protein product [Camellia sinensis]
MSGKEEDVKEHEGVDEDVPEDSEKAMPSPQQEEEAVKSKYGGIMPKKPPLISKDHERAYFDSADWALGKQGGEKPKGPLKALQPKLQFSIFSQHNSKPDTGNRLVVRQMVKERTLHQRMQLQMNERPLLVF